MKKLRIIGIAAALFAAAPSWAESPYDAYYDSYGETEGSDNTAPVDNDSYYTPPGSGYTTDNDTYYTPPGAYMSGGASSGSSGGCNTIADSPSCPSD